MVLSYPFDIIKHYFLIEEMNCHRHQDKVHIVSALMDIIIHWIKPMVSYDIGHQIVMTLSNYYIA